MIQIDVRLTPSERVVSDGLWAYVLHDHELPDGLGLSRLERIDPNYKNPGFKPETRGDPEVNKLLGGDVNGDRIIMTRTLQEFWFAILQKTYPGRTYQEYVDGWLNLTTSDRAYTNKTGWIALDGSPGFAEYITGKNLNKEPMRAEKIVCGGNFLRLTTGIPFEKGIARTKYYEIEAINVRTANMADLTHLLMLPMPNRYVHLATISRREILPDGSRMVIPFWQKTIQHVGVPNWSNSDTSAILAERVRVIPKGELLPSSPFYNPKIQVPFYGGA